MRVALAVALALAATTAAAQDRAPQRRAPLADVAELEPAVDVAALPRPAPAAPSASSASEPAAPAAATELEAHAVPPSLNGPPPPRVMDALDLGTTSITGNAELPKVLYIVPWKKSDLGDLVGRPVNTLLDEVLAPVDPAVFERHLNYYDSLYGEREEE
jgi:hypothetical protein